MNRNLRFHTLFITTLFLLVFQGCSEAAPDKPFYGPDNGTLVIAGGGKLPPVIFERFAELAGGFDAGIVIIPTAGSPDNIDTSRVREKWENAGFTNITVLHTTDPEEAGKTDFYGKIAEASGVWFEGGRQWRLVDAYYGTETYNKLHELLDRGGVIGGSSAGASIQGSFLARGDMSGNTIMISTDERHQKGFGFMKNTAIDQHIDTRDRWTDIQEIILEHPELLGIGISESTAIVVKGDEFEVIGAGDVAITTEDIITGSDNDNLYLVLSPGENFNIKLLSNIYP